MIDHALEHTIIFDVTWQNHAEYKIVSMRVN